MYDPGLCVTHPWPDVRPTPTFGFSLSCLCIHESGLTSNEPATM
jgi:hypothetical protein